MIIAPTLSLRNDLPPIDWSPGRTARRPLKLTAFLLAQRVRLLELRAVLANSASAVARASRTNQVEASPSSDHPADAGSDACDRDFALGLLAHEQNALAEIDLALERIEVGTYGICELSGRPIPRARLEAIPFARHTVERQAEMERKKKRDRFRPLSRPVFVNEEEPAPEGSRPKSSEGEVDDQPTGGVMASLE